MQERTITIRVPDDLYDRVKIEAIKRKTTLKGYIVGLIESDLKTKE